VSVSIHDGFKYLIKYIKYSYLHFWIRFFEKVSKSFYTHLLTLLHLAGRFIIKEFYMRVVILLSLLILAGCQSNKAFEKVDFKYSNLAHMTIDEALVELDVDPKSLIFALGQSFMAQNNLVLERQKLDFNYQKSDNYINCWSAQNEVFRNEFYAYQLNNFSIYQSIDRQGIFKKFGVNESCTLMDMVKSEEAESWFLQVEIPQGNYQTTVSVPNVESFFSYSPNGAVFGNATTYSQKVVRTEFASRLYIWAWKVTPESKTKVYLLSKPINGQVEACNGCTIGYNWWKQANGYSEFKLVKKYKYLLEDLAQKVQLQHSIETKVKVPNFI